MARSLENAVGSSSSELRELHERLVRHLRIPGAIVAGNEESTSLRGFYPTFGEGYYPRSDFTPLWRQPPSRGQERPFGSSSDTSSLSMVDPVRFRDLELRGR